MLGDIQRRRLDSMQSPSGTRVLTLIIASGLLLGVLTGLGGASAPIFSTPTQPPVAGLPGLDASLPAPLHKDQLGLVQELLGLKGHNGGATAAQSAIDTARVVLAHRQGLVGTSLPEDLQPLFDLQQGNLDLSQALLGQMDAAQGDPHLYEVMDMARAALAHREVLVGTILSEQVGALLGLQQGNLDLAQDLLAHIDAADGASNMQEAIDLGRIALSHREQLIGTFVPEGLQALLEQQERNLDAAERLIAKNQAGPAPRAGDSKSKSGERENALLLAVDLAQEATRWQVKTFGLDWVDPFPLAGYSMPSQAVSELKDRFGASASPMEQEAIFALDAQPEPLRSALAAFVDAFLSLDSAARQAYKDLDVAALVAAALDGPGQDQPTSADALLSVHGLELAPVFSTRNQFLAATLDMAAALDGAELPFLSECAPIAIPPAFSIDLSRCDNVYTQDFALLLDAGGSDRYYTNAGGSSLGGNCTFENAVDFLDADYFVSAALVDLGEEPDVYGNPEAPRGCGANGGGFLGLGMLIAQGGDNTYTAHMFGTNGGGALGGIGLLLEANGDDLYEATDYGTNGGGRLGGIGLLVDARGDDSYSSGDFGTNGGGDIGAGTLIDSSGSDSFVAGSQGTNGGGHIGVGFLLNMDGSNEFTAGGHGTNGGAVGEAAGFLFNAGGDDVYAATSVGTNGGGAGGIGMLIDANGDDTYTAMEQGTNGGGSGRGMGFLVDRRGDDRYSAGGSGTNGGGSFGGFGLLVDLEGDDAYAATQLGTNGGAYGGLDPGYPEEVHVSGGFLLDASGADSYTATIAGTNGGGADSAVGFLLDASGDDRYVAGYGGTNGGGDFFGVGALLDLSGDDDYLGQSRGTNGGASGAGVGLLFDLTGDDSYTAGGLGANGGGYAQGAGLLVDLSGEDVYAAGSSGVNGGGEEGFGFLMDFGGNDRYTAIDRGANGGSLFSGAGFLYDGWGDDLYETGGGGGANGGGSNGGVGILLDAAGNDRYSATHAGVNGGAFQGVGILVDGGGNDWFIGTEMGVNGGAVLGGYGVLFSVAGDDHYLASGCGANGGGSDQTCPDLEGLQWPGRGLLLDGGGRDRYQDALVDCWDCTMVPKGAFGAQVDVLALPSG